MKIRRAYNNYVGSSISQSSIIHVYKFNNTLEQLIATQLPNKMQQCDKDVASVSSNKKCVYYRDKAEGSRIPSFPVASISPGNTSLRRWWSGN
jgi:hypothetical protein